MFIDFTRKFPLPKFIPDAEWTIRFRFLPVIWGYTDSRQDEQDRGITVKASSMSLVLQDSKAHPYGGIDVGWRWFFGLMD